MMDAAGIDLNCVQDLHFYTRDKEGGFFASNTKTSPAHGFG